jgi:hypothetical protein
MQFELGAAGCGWRPRYTRVTHTTVVPRGADLERRVIGAGVIALQHVFTL